MLKSDHNRKQFQTNQTEIVTLCSLLSLSKQINIFSGLLTISALVIGFIYLAINDSNLISLICFFVFILGLISQYYALRTNFDIKLFEYLTPYIHEPSIVLKELDHALVKLGLIKSDFSKSRTMYEREKGTLRLFKIQIVTVMIQLLLLIGGFASRIIYNLL